MIRRAAILGGLWLAFFVATHADANPPKNPHRCKIYDDEQGFPHVLAPDETGAWACLGYLHGRDRTWQMDYLRRIAQGRSAEVLGPGSLKTDYLMRLLGISEEAQRLTNAFSADRRARFDAYADGVTAGFGESADSYEFQRLKYQPEPWTVTDSVSLLLLQSFEQTADSFEAQINQEAWGKTWIRAHGAVTPDSFGSDGLPWDTSILKPGEFVPTPLLPAPSAPARSAEEAREFERGLLAALPRSPFGRDGGSNNWVVDPSRSSNGHALLANDPHLTIGYPPFWYFAHLQGGGLNVIGATLPGIPQVASGANDHVAWGLTNSNLSDARLSYIPESELQGAVTQLPIIYFKLGPLRIPYFFKAIRRTANGWPILPISSPTGKAVVLRWSGFDLNSNDLVSFEDLMRANSATAADSALASIGLPSWNFVFADDAGTIGYRTVGRIPRWKTRPAFGIPEETLTELGSGASFPDILGPEEMPHVFSPKRGYVATANNRQWPAGGNPDPGWAQNVGFRAFRIEELLTAPGATHDVESFRKIQCDTQAVDARFIASLLAMRLDGKAHSRRERQALAAIARWDFDASLDCQACGVYRRWVDRLLADLNLNLDFLYRLAALPPSLASAQSAELDRRLLPDLDAALDDLGVDASTSKLAEWGTLHLAFFHHLAGKGFVPEFPISTPGDDYSVDVGTAVWTLNSPGPGGHYDHNSGASQRLVVDLATPPTVYSILAGPNVDLADPDPAAPGSPWRDWADCKLTKRAFPLNWASVSAREVDF